MEAPRASRSLLRTGWVPAILATIVVTGLLWSTDVPAWSIARFVFYVATGLVLPGTLLWRGVMRDRSRPFVFDVVCGTSFAYTVELAVYIPARMLDVPVLVVVWPWLVVALTLLPRHRDRFWGRLQNVGRQPLWWSWAAAAVVSAAFLWLWAEVWRIKPVTLRGLRFPYVDDPYHLSLVSGLRRQLPTDLPFADGEPLWYHWFVHAEIAASSWSSGVEPILLLQRLSLVPMIAVVILGVAVIVQRLTRSPLAGLVTGVMLALAGGARIPFNSSTEFLQVLLYLSPTMTFADVLEVATIALVILALRSRLSPGAWAAAVLALAALSGAKGPALPIVVAGLVAVLFMAAVFERRLHRQAAALAVVGILIFLVARELLYDGSDHGLAIGPLSYLDGRAVSLGLVTDPAEISARVSGVLFALDLFSQFAFAAGILAHFRAGRWRDPVAHFLLGGTSAGWGAAILLESPMLNQLYFKHAALVFTIIAGGWGFGILVKDLRDRSSGFLLLGAAVGTGLLCWALTQAVDTTEPSGLFVVALPTLAVLAFIIALSLLVWIVTRTRAERPGLVAAVAAAAVMGTGLPYLTTAVDGEHPVLAPRAVMGVGGVEAARWVRDHSSSDEIVATNQHCIEPTRRTCDTRSFWVSGYTERQVLVEGWGYASRNNERSEQLGLPMVRLPYWDPALLEANDAMFERPTAETLELMADEHDVRWLVADLRLDVAVQDLDRLATRRYRSSDYAVYELDD